MFILILSLLYAEASFSAAPRGKTNVKVFGNWAIDVKEKNGCPTHPTIVALVEEQIVNPSGGGQTNRFTVLGYTLAQTRAAYQARLTLPERIGRAAEFEERVETTAVEVMAHTIYMRSKRERCAPPRLRPRTMYEKAHENE